MRVDGGSDHGVRVLMFCPTFRPLTGGAERQIELLAETLAGLGTRIEVLTPRYEPTWPMTETSDSGVRIHRYPFLDLRRRLPVRGIGVLNTALIGVTTTRAVRRLVSDCDVLHIASTSVPMSAFVARAARRASRPTMARVTSTGSLFDLRVLRRHPGWGAIATRWLRACVDAWHAPSLSVADELRAANIAWHRIHHIPNGVAVPGQACPLPERASRFLYLGRFAPTAPRDVEGLIRAFDSVVRAAPEVELALVGGGDNLEQIRALAAASPSATRISVPGYQRRDDWLGWAHCLVQPSFVEGMSNALLEAMAAGLACVAYDIPPNREVLDGGGAGLLVPVGDVDGLAAALGGLASVPGRAASWGTRARHRAEHAYDAGTVARRLLTVYRRLAGSSPSTQAERGHGEEEGQAVGSPSVRRRAW